MIRTVETRWFHRTQPFPVSEFFNVANQLKSRTDWYAFPCDERSGIKTREGNFEVKLRVRELGTETFGAAIGRVEEWVKWSVAFPEDDNPPKEHLGSTGWISVEKIRNLRVFEVNGNTVREIHDWVTNCPDNGCQFEWTELLVNDMQCWTVGFEAFGIHDQLHQNLTSVVNHVFSAAKQLTRFKDINSFAYPKWLQQIQVQEKKGSDLLF